MMEESWINRTEESQEGVEERGERGGGESACRGGRA